MRTGASARAMAHEGGVAVALVVLFSTVSALGLAQWWRAGQPADSDPFDGVFVGVVFAAATTVLAFPLGALEGLKGRPLRKTVKRWVAVGVAATVVPPLIVLDRLVPRGELWADAAGLPQTMLWASAAVGSAIISAILAALIWRAVQSQDAAPG